MIEIYDNPTTWDRYTIITDDGCYGMSANALSPQGFNQFIGERHEIKGNLGLKITHELIAELPNDVLVAILQRLTS